MNITIDQAFEIQKEQMAKWKKLLKDDVYQKFETFVEKINTRRNIRSFEDGPRGVELEEILLNRIAAVV